MTDKLTQRRGRAFNPRLLDRKSDALLLSHRATRRWKNIEDIFICFDMIHERDRHTDRHDGIRRAYA